MTQARATQLAVELAAEIADQDFADGCEVRAVRKPKFRLEDAVETTQIQVFPVGQAVEITYRDAVTKDWGVQIGVFRLLSTTDEEPDDDELDDMLLLTESILNFASQRMSEISWAGPVILDNDPLYDMEFLEAGRFLTVINVTFRGVVEF